MHSPEQRRRRALYIAGWLLWIWFAVWLAATPTPGSDGGADIFVLVILLLLGGVVDLFARLLIWIGRGLFGQQSSPAHDGQQVIVIRQGGGCGCGTLGCAGSFLALLGLALLVWVALSLIGVVMTLLFGVAML